MGWRAGEECEGGMRIWRMSRPSAFYCFHRKQFKVVSVKLSAIIILLALVMAPVLAYDVGMIVTVSQDTLAVGTSITIVKDGTLLYSAKADGNGAASFQLDPGSYFVYLDRGGYSRHVNLLEVSKTENITYTMRQLISYASAYGQVTGPADFSNASVAAYAKGNVAKRTTPNKDGYYLMSFMPEGEYEMAFSAQGFVGKNVSASLMQSQFSEVNVKLDKIPVVPIAQPTITMPSAVQKQSVIEIVLMRGSLPLSGQVVFVKTPAGDVEVTTGANGKAYVNAVKPGEYVFTYGNLTSKTMVEGKVDVPVQPPAVIPEPEAPPAPVQQKPEVGGLVAGTAVIAMGGAIVAIGIILFAASRMVKKQKPKAEAGAHEEKEPVAPAKPESSEKPGHAPAHKHAHEHAHKHKK